MNTLSKQIAVFGALFFATWTQAVTVDLSPSSTSVSVGRSIDVQFRIAGLGQGTGPSLAAYDIILGFDPLILEFTSFTVGDPSLGNQLDLTGLGTLHGYDSSTPGQLRVVEASQDAPIDLLSRQAADFALGTMSFTTVGAGTSPLEFSYVFLQDPLNQWLFADYVGGSVQVMLSSTKVPEGGNSAWLLMISTLCLVARSRFSKAT